MAGRIKFSLSTMFFGLVPLNVALAVAITQRLTIWGALGLFFVFFWCGMVWAFCADQIYRGDDSYNNS